MARRNTDNLIRDLAATAAPVRRLPQPALRALAWFGIAVPYVVLVALAMRPRADLVIVLQDPAFLANILGGAAVAVVAAAAAFASSVPGYGAWRRMLLMLVPLGWFAWFGGRAVLTDVAAPAAAVGWQCMLSLLVFAGVPVIAMALLLRRAAPLTPGRTLVYGALAAGAIADVGARICHNTDGVGHLVWHVGAVALLAGAAASVAPKALRWRAT